MSGMFLWQGDNGVVCKSEFVHTAGEDYPQIAELYKHGKSLCCQVRKFAFNTDRAIFIWKKYGF